MKPLDHQKARARIGFALAAGIALATVAALPPAASAATDAAIDEYVLTPPGGGAQEIPATQPSPGAGGASSASGAGVLAAGESGRGPVAAALDSVGQIPPALIASAIAVPLCLLTMLLASRRRREPAPT